MAPDTGREERRHRIPSKGCPELRSIEPRNAEPLALRCDSAQDTAPPFEEGFPSARDAGRWSLHLEATNPSLPAKKNALLLQYGVGIQPAHPLVLPVSE